MTRTLAPKMEVGALRQLYQAHWAGLYEARLSALNAISNAHTLLPLGDNYYGAPNATTFTGARYHASGLAPTWTWSEAWATFDGHDAVADTPDFPYRYQGIIPIIAFNASDEEADTPDAAFWSVGNGASDGALSILVWLKMTSSASAKTILAKYSNGAATGEWYLRYNNADKLQFVLRDQSVPVQVDRTADAASPTGVWTHCVATYNGAGGASAMNGATLYVNGTSIASSAGNDISYVAMEDGADPVGLGMVPAGPADFFNGQLAGGPLGPVFIKAALTAAQVKNDYEFGRRLLGL